MSSSSFAGVKRTALSFKGEAGREKKKRRGKADTGDDVVNVEGGEAPEKEIDVPVVPGSGRIVTNTTTIHGFETKFKDELEVGDTIMVHHPTSLEVELRMVVSVLSQRSSVLHQAFSKDLSSTCEFHIRKDSLKIKEKAKAEIEEDNPELLQDAASRELQRQLDKRLKTLGMAALDRDAPFACDEDIAKKSPARQKSKGIMKQAKTVSVREKTGMWGYKVVTKKLSKASSAEDALDERCKQGRDKWCCI
eukprot:s3650_g6.t2